MLSSERKIRKLFIKFLTWNKKMKAINLLDTYLECIMPWQKAFESAADNNNFDICLWILEQQSKYSFIIDIHYNDNIVIKKLENMAIMFQTSNGQIYEKYLEQFISLDKTIIVSVN